MIRVTSGGEGVRCALPKNPTPIGPSSPLLFYADLCPCLFYYRAIHYTARLSYGSPSVCPSVRPSVALLYPDHIDWHFFQTSHTNVRSLYEIGVANTVLYQILGRK